jgi:hypothetical protein
MNICEAKLIIVALCILYNGVCCCRDGEGAKVSQLCYIDSILEYSIIVPS